MNDTVQDFVTYSKPKVKTCMRVCVSLFHFHKKHFIYYWTDLYDTYFVQKEMKKDENKILKEDEKTNILKEDETNIS